MSALRQEGPALGRVLRTLRHIGPRQAIAQLRHAALGTGRPRSVAGPAPELATARASVDFLGPPRHARWDGDGCFELLNRRVGFHGGVDWDFAGEGPLWAYQLHQFDYARCPVDPAARTALLLDWVERHRAGTGWDPHPISLRTFAWGKLLLTEGALAADADASETIRLSLASQVETLARNLEHRLRANHLLSNLLAVAFAGVLFEGRLAARWRDRVPALRGELARQIGADGAHEERSPMYHALLLESVLDLLNVARSVGDRAPVGLVAELVETASRMLGALAVWTHPDGEIALFGDSALGVAQPPGRLHAYASELGVVPRLPATPGFLPNGGVAALRAGDLHLIASLAGPRPAHQPGHAHCDALAFELSAGRTRVVTDTGVLEYRPGALRDASRSTRSHATVEVAGVEQSELWSAHRIGGRARVDGVAVEAGRRLEAACAGWATRDTVHRRSFEVVGGAIEIRDAIEGRPRAVRLALPLAPGLSPRLAGEPGGPQLLSLALPGRRTLRVELPAPGAVRWRLETAPAFPEFGWLRQRACLLGESDEFRDGVWRFELSTPGLRVVGR